VRRDSKPEIEVPRKARFAVADGADAATGWVVGLSMVGAQIESLQPPALGCDVVLWVELVPGGGPIELRGRVQWATATRFAVQFGALGAREASAIVRASSRSAA
jgi:hypothetical protein